MVGFEDFLEFIKKENMLANDPIFSREAFAEENMKHSFFKQRKEKNKQKISHGY